MDTIEVLREHIPGIVNEMPERFNSHKFIQRLAQRHQADYVRALYAYVERGNNAPFQAVHAAVASALQNSGLVREIEREKSVDIFGTTQIVPVWLRAK